MALAVENGWVVAKNGRECHALDLCGDLKMVMETVNMEPPTSQPAKLSS